MTLIGEFRFPANIFPLSEALTEGIVSRIDPVPVTLAPCMLSPFLWVVCDDYSTFNAALNADDSVTNHTRLDIVDDTALYRVRYAAPPQPLADILSAINASVTTASGSTSGWRCQIRFPRQEAVQIFRDRLREAEISFSILSLLPPTTKPAETLLGLTPKQAEALQAAWTLGYYEQPSRTTLTEIGNKLGISEQALSDRLRRAHHTIIKKVVIDGSYFGFEREQ